MRVGAPVPEVYCAGFTEWTSQLSAVVLTQTSVCPIDFKACAGTACVVTATLLLFAKFPSSGAEDQLAEELIGSGAVGSDAILPAPLIVSVDASASPAEVHGAPGDGMQDGQPPETAELGSRPTE